MSPTKGLPATPSKHHSLDLEKLQAKCQQLQDDLDKVCVCACVYLDTLSTGREEFQLKESKMDASLTTTRRANHELEVRMPS